MFFRATNGFSYPVAAITKMETPYREGGQPVLGPLSTVKVHLGDDALVIAHQLEIDRIRSQPITSFAAAPGTFLVSVEDGDVERKPVIGWSVSADGVQPILIHGIFDDPEEEWVVQTPDGSVGDEHSNFWRDLDAYHAYRQARTD